MTYPGFDFLDQREWIRQELQTGAGTNHAVAYNRIQFRYNDIGQLTYINRFETPTTVVGTPSLRTVLEFDDANRLELLSHKAAHDEVSVTPLNEYVFGYDFASRITSIDSTLDGLTQFSYSTSNQLTEADHAPSRPDEGYLYDANGNRIGTGFIVDPQNRTLSDGVYDYDYDHEGNRTFRTRISDGSFEVNTFDHRNRLTQVDSYSFGDEVGVDAPNRSISYTYDAFQRMVRRTVDTDGDGTAEIDQFFAGFDGDNSTLEFETDGSVSAMASDLAHRRLYGPFIDQLIAQENVASLATAGETLWPLTDHTGTVRDVAVLNDGIVGGGGTSGDFELVSHRVYNSFGLLTNEFEPNIDPVTGSPLPTGLATSIDLDAGFTGRFHDDLTGLTHHQNRWFDPRLGKWISEDPLGFAAGDVNTTRYVGNAPLTYTDPTGLIAVGIAGGNGDSGNGFAKDISISGEGIHQGIEVHYRDSNGKIIGILTADFGSSVWRGREGAEGNSLTGAPGELILGFVDNRLRPNLDLNDDVRRTTPAQDERAIAYILETIGKDKAWFENTYLSGSKPATSNYPTVGEWDTYAVLCCLECQNYAKRVVDEAIPPSRPEVYREIVEDLGYDPMVRPWGLGAKY